MSLAALGTYNVCVLYSCKCIRNKYIPWCFLTYITYQRQYLIVNHIGAIRAEHDDFTVRFISSINQVSRHVFSCMFIIYHLQVLSAIIHVF